MKQIYNKIIAYPYIALILGQFFLLVIAFHKLIRYPFTYSFNHYYDGLKNYFTFFEFIKQDITEKGILHFGMMNYPFGEYVYFTDNTPLLSVPLRFINHYIVDISAYLNPIHNGIYLVIWLITPVVAYPLFKKILPKMPLFAIFMSIACFWLNPQLLRLNAGHFNLTLSILFILCFRYLFFFYSFRFTQEKKLLFKLGLYPLILIFLSGFIHLYYIVLLAYTISVFIGSLSLYESIKKRTLYWRQALVSLLGVFSAGIGVYVIILFTDEYAALRKSVAGGYGWNQWAFTPEAVISAYSHSLFNPLFFMKNSLPELYYESYGYWGAFVLVLILVLFIYAIYLLFSRKITFQKITSRLFPNGLWVALSITIILCYAAASGDYVKLNILPLKFDNLISPFYYLSGHVDLITQFRCIARFSWGGYWGILLFSVYLFASFIQYMENRKAKKIVVVVFSLLLSVDVYSAVAKYYRYEQWNHFKDEVINDKFSETNSLDYTSYQAVFSIPAVHVGSENYDYTLDANNEWTMYWMQLVAKSKLPTFNCKMSRTAENQAKAQVDLLKDGAVPSFMLNQLSQKPILVVYNPLLLKDETLYVTTYGKKATENSPKLINSFSMDTLFIIDNIYYFEWDIKKNY